MSSSAPLASPRLRRLAERPRSSPPIAAPSEHCELCGAEIPEEHRHLVDLDARVLRCACRACSLLFDRSGAGAGRLRLVPDRRLRLNDLALSDVTWERLRIPVEIAFFFRDSGQNRVVAFYPSPTGATESRLELEHWEQVERDNPVLATMAPDVEALLVDRTGHARRYWLVPIEDPYRLVALIRTRWRGFTGGREVWEAIERFFAELDQRARGSERGTTMQRS
ncbi:MAG: hypothetical protein JO168_04240 [Solirubrobacterales bacterium]|nr:hypothetical protein [Solirubrobacterales bacterium]MBV9716669.1 hypothetical protein [Solirubrobacterales bacterium]